MTTLTPPHPADVATITAALAEFNAATKAHGRSDAIDASVIDTVIAHLAAQGRPFSSNDMRSLLPVVRKCLVSRRLIVAQNAGQIVATGWTRSNLRSTHGAVVRVYSPVGAS